jgi:hypothetical protein
MSLDSSSDSRGDGVIYGPTQAPGTGSNETGVLVDVKQVTDPEDLLALLGIAHRSQLGTLASAVTKHMDKNVLLYLVTAPAYNIESLEDACLAYLDERVMFTLRSPWWKLVGEVRGTAPLLKHCRPIYSKSSTSHHIHFTECDDMENCDVLASLMLHPHRT